MFGYLFLLFTIIPAIELAVLIKVGTYIGVGNTLLLLFLSGITGAALARSQGFSTLNKIQVSLQEGRMPTEEMLDGVMILIGGILLLTPGFITDIFGFLLLIPLSRALIKIWIRKKLSKILAEGDRISPRARSGNKFNHYEDAEFH